MSHYSARRVLFTFLSGSVLTAFIFALCVLHSTFHWFQTEEIWTFPTQKLWMLTAALFFGNLIGASFVSYFADWVNVSVNRLILAALLFAIATLSIGLMASVSALSQILLFRLILALVALLALLILTRRWYWLLAVLALVFSLLTPIIAGVSYFVSASLEWFEVMKFFVHSSLLALFFSCWLLKATRRAHRPPFAGESAAI